MAVPRLRADFNGVFGNLLCLSHSEEGIDENGDAVQLCAGMEAVAFEENYEDGIRDDILAEGIVERSPDWLQCLGSRWVLRIDHKGSRAR